MTDEMTRPNVGRILGGLKDFQRDTVDYVFRRLYTDADRTHRFLLADEVGLGKTLIAKGVVARAVDHMWETVRRIDVVYICSSGDIARQNVNKLNISGRENWALASRVTMLPTQLREIQHRKVNFIAFTPGTTFKLASSGGKSEERVLLYSLLKTAWGIGGAGAKNLLQGWVSNHDRFRYAIEQFDHETVDPYLREKFAEAVRARVEKDAKLGQPGLKARFDELCERFGRKRDNIPKQDRIDQSRLIGELRSLLASTCIRALEPDLVILDEFQRFKDLLTVGDEEEPEEKQLARELFDYAEGSEKTRILLLSATPYKMYTTADESGEEDHYADFRQTLRFLHDDASRSARIEELLERYRRDMLRIADRRAELLDIRKEIEFELRRVMVRTERLAASDDRNGMLREVAAAGIALTVEEALAYRDLHRVARAVEHPDTIEYWKAAPYPLSFMDDYKLKQDVEDVLEDPSIDPAAAEAIRSARSLFLSKERVETRQPLLPPHARMRWLLDLCLGQDMWRLLWIPATAPYYAPRGVFASFAGRSVTKQLVFSAWQVVPKAIAALVTYEAERRMFEGVARPGESLTAARDRLVPLLRFNRSGDRLTGLPVMGMIYPSFRLAALGDPLDLAFAGQGEGVDALLDRLTQRIDAELQPIIESRATTMEGAEDESWYWAAPLLLDVAADRRTAVEWIRRDEAAAAWAGTELRRRGPGFARTGDEEMEADSSAWEDHVGQMRDALALSELGRPPADLARVLAEFAFAGPAVCALRALTRGARDAALKDAGVRDAAGQIAFAYRNLFNLPEARAIIGSAIEPYWRAVLGYAIDGNLQAVLDEYVHVLRDAVGLSDQDPGVSAPVVAEEVRKALSLRTTRVSVDELTKKGQLSQHNLRASYAVRFGEEVDVDGKRANRKDLVRAAFNSPFWPFVLASTSVGQEGLDFHLYCHSVIHWNLPSNPVDLEQREGRVHRFKGHAVRKNVAAKHDTEVTAGDRWASFFAAAHAARPRNTTDVVPFWVYSAADGSFIERHVPALPLSRDEVRLRQLKRSLALYRMVFGQPRQDELLDFLLSQMPPDEAQVRLDELRIDLSPSSGVGRKDLASGASPKRRCSADSGTPELAVS